MSFLSITKLNKFVGQKQNRFHALKDLSLEVERGQFVVIIGQSGSGKSTLMNILGCLDTPTNGSYKIDDIESTSLSTNELATLRCSTFGFVFQRYNLISGLTALDNVALPAVYKGMPKEQRLERATKLLQQLGLGDKLNNKPGELSGGQQQRISIARALMNGGEIILADEPTGALDSQNGEAVIKILLELNKSGHTIILVTHNPAIAAHADRIVELQDGGIVRETNTNQASLGSIATGKNNLMVERVSFFEQLVEALNMSIKAIASHSLRSSLTMLGIVIGIASVVSVVGLGRSSQEKIMADIRAIGTNTIDIYPGEGVGDIQAPRFNSLKIEDVNILRQQPYISGVSPVTTAVGLAIVDNFTVNVSASAVNDQFFAVRGLKLAQGRFFNGHDVADNVAVAVIDQKTKSSLFPQTPNPIGRIILFSNRPLEVIGMLETTKNPFLSADKPNIFLPYTTMMYKINGNKNLDSIVMKIKDDIISQVAEKNITNLLLSMRNGRKDFFTFNTDSIKQTIEKTSNTMTMLVSGIALISLIVGGIGVMNIMLVSVTERTSEIGIRMSIGATQQDILTQFLLESIMICILGGSLGIILSFFILPVLNFFVKEFVVSASVDSMLLALFCAAFIGVLFGFIPARNASQLSPIDALGRD